MTKQLTIPEGIKIQQNQLAEWKTVLTPEAFAYVEAECKRQNEELIQRDKEVRKLKYQPASCMVTGYDVWRGESINAYINNMAMNGGKPRE